MSFDDVARRMQARNGEHMQPPGIPANVDDLTGEAFKAANRKRVLREIAVGAILLVAGIAITAGTYGHASQSGGSYFVAYGPIVIGVISLFRGLIRLGG